VVSDGTDSLKLSEATDSSCTTMIFPSLYNAPVCYYAILIRNRDKVVIEQYDHYSKQTYRNRCRILGANGIIDLTIPVIKYHGKKVLMKDVRIDYDTNWNRNHWTSIYSAYASAPFFEFMEDTFFGYYSKRYTFLIDLNTELFCAALELLQVTAEFSKSDYYMKHEPENDLREAIHPKRAFHHPEYTFHPAIYQQVFSDRHGFNSDLSILDLLFNEGPNALPILSDSISGKKNPALLSSSGFK